MLQFIVSPTQVKRGVGRSTPAVCKVQRGHVYACAQGYRSKFDGDGRFLSEEKYVEKMSDVEQALIAEASEGRPRALHDRTLIAFHSGSVSRGPGQVSVGGKFACEALLPLDGQRVSVRVEYVYGKRSGIQVTQVGTAGVGVALEAFGRTAPLDARSIAGHWKGDNYRWSALEPPNVLRGLGRDYASTNSTSSLLVRLPLNVSVVAPAMITSGVGFSFGCGWSPADCRQRPVMIRSYGTDGRLLKVDWRMEVRQVG